MMRRTNENTNFPTSVVIMRALSRRKGEGFGESNPTGATRRTARKPS